MKYSIISEADGPIECQCNGELYLASEMENLSLTDGCPVQPVPWRQSVNARDAGRLKSQFMRSAKLPVRDGAAGSPQGGSRDGFQMAAGWMGAGLARPGRRLKAPGEGNRGQRGMRYGDLSGRAAKAVAHSGPFWGSRNWQAAREGLQMQCGRARQPLQTAAQNALQPKLRGPGSTAGSRRQHCPSQ